MRLWLEIKNRDYSQAAGRFQLPATRHAARMSTATMHKKISDVHLDGFAMREHFACFRFATYDGQQSPWVFHHITTRRRAKAGERIGVLRRAFEGAARRAKLPSDLHQHDLRHRRVTTWLAAGGDAVKVKEAMGHADLRTTMDYTHLVRDNLRSLVEVPSGSTILVERGA